MNAGEVRREVSDVSEVRQGCFMDCMQLHVPGMGHSTFALVHSIFCYCRHEFLSGHLRYPCLSHPFCGRTAPPGSHNNNNSSSSSSTFPKQFPTILDKAYTSTTVTGTCLPSASPNSDLTHYTAARQVVAAASSHVPPPPPPCSARPPLPCLPPSAATPQAACVGATSPYYITTTTTLSQSSANCSAAAPVAPPVTLHSCQPVTVVNRNGSARTSSSASPVTVTIPYQQSAAAVSAATAATSANHHHIQPHPRLPRINVAQLAAADSAPASSNYTTGYWCSSSCHYMAVRH